MPAPDPINSDVTVTASMKASIKVWLDADEDDVAIHYQGTATIEKMAGTANKFRLFINGNRVMPDGSKVTGNGIVVLPSESDWKLECHHLQSANASARVLLLKPEHDVIRKVQIVLPIDENSPATHSKVFAEVMETCSKRAQLEDGAVISISLDQLFGALDSSTVPTNTEAEPADVVAEEITAAANFLAAMDPFLFGGDDNSSSDEEEEEDNDDEAEEDWN